eukprot:scaffold3299_cov116-Isochrysis_galbana.AAC.11
MRVEIHHVRNCVKHHRAGASRVNVGHLAHDGAHRHLFGEGEVDLRYVTGWASRKEGRGEKRVAERGRRGHGPERTAHHARSACSSQPRGPSSHKVPLERCRWLAPPLPPSPIVLG